MTTAAGRPSLYRGLVLDHFAVSGARCEHFLNGFRVVFVVELDLVKALEDHGIVILHRLACGLIEPLGLVFDGTTLVIHAEELCGAPRSVRILVLLEDLVLTVVQLRVLGLSVATAFGRY